ncbi:putative quinol monooxygenase [Thalassotalea loyana]|nr:antibiotic biosynthesis monooxygenase [Thalassotalea loyana]
MMNMDDNYGLISKIVAIPGKREELADILVNGTQGMPGCISYVIAKDPQDADALWITEVWQSQTMHQSSLSLPTVQDAMIKGKPLIDGILERIETQPIGQV